MQPKRFDIIIIGAGPAGVTAAGALAGSGVSVALLEAGAYAGAENWSGCVYFAENLSLPECFGPEAVRSAPFERKVVRRGTLMHNGRDVVGVELAGADVYRDCYTVLRPIYDAYFADLARRKGAFLIADATVTSLIRRNGRVVGVETARGPLHADVVFIAEGDASHLVRSERLERTEQPHFLQGLKAVFSLDPGAIEKCFRLNAGEGAAYELLIRNPSIAGRTSRLNIGAFLYTNRDSVSLGYVVPLENVRDHYRGSHDLLFEWLRGLPWISERIADSRLSAYGAKIIRSGGWNERPILVEDGLAVGGASAGLGIDLPFPNFTGPASATGLYFARAVRSILRDGGAFDTRTLGREYLAPLEASVYGRNAKHLSRWPRYFGRSSVLFGRTIDVTCGSARFLSRHGLLDAGRFLRGHLLSLRGIRELAGDAFSALRALRLGRPLIRTLLDPRTLLAWTVNSFKGTAMAASNLGLVLRINDQDTDISRFPWPIRSVLTRITPALSQALSTVYANDGVPLSEKIARAVSIMVRALRLADLVTLPAYGMLLLCASVASAAIDALRYYIFRAPAEAMLAEPAMEYGEEVRRARGLDAVVPVSTIEAKLATNSYRPAGASHIRVLWPDAVAQHANLASAGLWWLCPARVYGYDAPLLGRGRTSVTFDNCVKCESCWRAEPERVLWGRHTSHGLVYRPDSSSVQLLLQALREPAAAPPALPDKPLPQDEAPIPSPSSSLSRAASDACTASLAFRDSVARLPVSADASRRDWPRSLGLRLLARLELCTKQLARDGWSAPADSVTQLTVTLERHLSETQFFRAVYVCHTIERQIRTWLPDLDISQAAPSTRADDPGPALVEQAKALFPDRVTRLWEDAPPDEAWAGKIRDFIAENGAAALPCVRALAAIDPSLGLIAAGQLRAVRILSSAGRDVVPGAVAVNADLLDIRTQADTLMVRGTLDLVPLTAARALLLHAKGAGYLLPLGHPGVSSTPDPAIGFRAAGLSRITIDAELSAASAFTAIAALPDEHAYLAVALGAADYLCGRASEHALSRVQFPGQMLDTEGRDGIAKLGAVKAMVARCIAWRQFLATWYDWCLSFPVTKAADNAVFDAACAAAAALAFSPEAGCLGYDAGQVFGGFAYSEDDLLSRAYRDSSVFPFLVPGLDAAARLDAMLIASNGGGPAGAAQPSAPEEPLSGIYQELRDLERRVSSLPSGADPGLRGNARALVIGIPLLLARIEQALDRGESPESEAASAGILLEQLHRALHEADLSAGRGSVSPDASPLPEPFGRRVPIGTDYESFCTASETPHRSGAFLMSSFDRSPRYLPEMQLHDERLRKRWADLTAWFRENCSDLTYDGLPLERFIDREHRLPDTIVEGIKRNRWLATTIANEDHGLGWRKAEYYILNLAAGCFGDAGINLLIMANTSIGTTPVLLGLSDELPRVAEELAPLTKDPQALAEIGSRLARIRSQLAHPDPARIRREFESLMKLVDARIRQTRVVKYLAANFLRAFYGAGISGQRGDFAGFRAGLDRAAELFTTLAPDIRAALDELPRRERRHRFFLRCLGRGGVSAFALTEPTAGSDSGGVRTTARLLSVPLTPLGDGRYSFTPADGGPEQYVIDADRVEFTAEGMGYRTPDGAYAPVRYDRYDYATDRGERFYLFQGAERPFHDIGEVRTTTSGQAYEYYSLTGAKMWITNGRLATQFCVYAQTPEGVTGFMVDRHAPGLTVGADERKMGQRGSPTNEISLDAVRVPREAVIGYEGHGQVNALETLNVGRCGLAVVAGALMRKLMREALATLPPSPVRDRLLGEAAAVQFGSESLAYYLVGLFDRPHESVRMESAIAKFLCSEDLHAFLSLLEQAYGPKGQTERRLLEKARRDSRILTIYEGTNEVQRFLVLKDLIAMANTLPVLAADTGDENERMLAAWKNRLRGRLHDAARLLGDASWSDAMLQPVLFPLAEMAAEVLRLECVLHRMEWLAARQDLLGSAQTAPLLKAGERATVRSQTVLSSIEGRWQRGWERFTAGKGPLEVVAADAAFGRGAPSLPRPASQAKLLAPVRILAIVRPVAELSPSPRVVNGKIEEVLWTIEPLDRAGLSQAAAIKATSPGQVKLDVLMPGTVEHEPLLRRWCGAVPDRVLRLDTGHAGPHGLTAVVRSLEAASPYDLIVLGAHAAGEARDAGAHLAGALRRVHRPLDRLVVRTDGFGFERIAPPAVVTLAAAGTQTDPDLWSVLEGTARQIIVIQPPAGFVDSSCSYSLPPAPEGAGEVVTTVAGAADLIRSFAARSGTAAPAAFTGPVKPGMLIRADAVWSILDPADTRANRAVLYAARTIADASHLALFALIPCPRPLWPSLLAVANAAGADQAYCLDTGEMMLSIEGKREAVRMLLRRSDRLRITANEHWTDAFGLCAGEASLQGRRIRTLAGVSGIRRGRDGVMVLICPAYEEKLVREEKAADSLFMSVRPDAEFGRSTGPREFSAWSLDVAPGPTWTTPLPPEPVPGLAEAEVIIDIGYGIRDQSGLALAADLKTRLEILGLRPHFGATRKVTQDLKLLPLESQIGQTGIRVNPRLVIALGISGAPQHIDYLGSRAEIICFNKDPEAPLMRLNRTRSAPRVHPVAGDLFGTVKEIVERLSSSSG